MSEMPVAGRARLLIPAKDLIGPAIKSAFVCRPSRVVARRFAWRFRGRPRPRPVLRRLTAAVPCGALRGGAGADMDDVSERALWSSMTAFDRPSFGVDRRPAVDQHHELARLRRDGCRVPLQAL
jgi:hypothetical protein